MKKIMVFGAVFLIMLCSVFAESGFVQAWGESLTELEGKTLPGALGTLFGDEQINFHIELENNGEAIFGMVMENKMVKSVTSGGVAKPTLNVYTTEAAIQEIVSSASPPTALLNALKEKKITYKAVGFLNKIKFAFLSVFSNIAALFVSEETEPVEEKVAAGDNAGADSGAADADTSAGAAGGTAADSTAAGAGAVAGADGTAAGATTDTTACTTTVAGAVSGCTDTSATTSTDGTTTDTAGNAVDTAGNTADTAGTDTTAATDTTTTAGTLTTGAVADIPTGETHIIKMTNEGFSKSLLTINAGDTVVWENVRTGSVLNKAMIIGVRDCRNIKSKFYRPGESFSWTFEEPGECVVVDGIMTTQSSRIIIG